MLPPRGMCAHWLRDAERAQPPSLSVTTVAMCFYHGESLRALSPAALD